MTKIRINAKAVTQGSVTAIPVKRKTGKMGATIIHSHSADLYNQRGIIQSEYVKNEGMKYEINTPVTMRITFGFVRPKSVSVKRRPYMTTKPDTDKLVRAILDALTNVAYHDDSQVVEIYATKRYTEEDYIEIEVSEYLLGQEV